MRVGTQRGLLLHDARVALDQGRVSHQLKVIIHQGLGPLGAAIVPVAEVLEVQGALCSLNV